MIHQQNIVYAHLALITVNYITQH